METKKQLGIPMLLFIAMVALFPADKIAAQSQKILFEQISGNNNLSVGKINAIMKDELGFIWFSDQTNSAIIRYDGSYMKRYRHDPNNPNSLGGGYPECLALDDSGIIWIGFYGQGLDRFDPQTNTFTHYKHDPSDPNSLANDFVSAVQVDHLGNIWVGTSGGLDLLDPETGNFKHFSYDANDPSSLSCNTVRTLYEDRSGTLWVGTGMAFNEIEEGGLNRFDRNTGTFIRYLHDPEDPNSLIDNKVRAILEDSKGNFWVGTKGDGLHSMDRATGAFKRYPYDPAHPERLSRPPLVGRFDHITFIIEDAEENLWIGTEANGLNRYDPVTKTIVHFGQETDPSKTVTDNPGWDAYSESNSGWSALATDDGLVYLSTQQNSKLFKIGIYNNSIPFYTDKGEVNSFFEESPSVFWTATNNGLIREDLAEGTSQLFVHEPQNPNSISSNSVTNIYKDHMGLLWIGTSNGLNKFYPEAGTFQQYLPDPADNSSLGSEFIATIYEDKDLNLWLGMYDGGLEILDRTTGKFTHYRHDPSDESSLSGDAISTVIEDGQNQLWIGVIEQAAGINKFNRETQTFDRYLRGLSVISCCIDQDGILWVGAYNGLYKYDKDSDSFLDSSVTSALTTVMCDMENYLWLHTSEGIMAVNPNRENSILYGNKNGVQGLLEINAYKPVTQKQDGKLYFPALNGYYAFYPDRLNFSKELSPLYFTDLTINGESVTPKTDSPLSDAIFSAQEIKLNYNQNVFSLFFNAIDYHQAKEHILYYRLENYDADWRQGNAGDPASYFKVPSGAYTFRIKTANSGSGLWSEKSIQIVISPPWWATWWAYILYALLLVCAIYATHKFQKARLLRKERSKTRDRELAQAKEIEKAYRELKATQAQLIQSEKMASLGELTAGIAHEIQNPLNFVNNFSEVNKELLDELDVEATKGNLAEVKDLVKDIKANEEKINHHGKRADAIVKGMLQHSRSSSGVKEPTDINALADEYLRLAYHGLRAKDKSFNATMKTDFDTAIGNINVVPQEMGRVILNLITNAFYAVSERSSFANSSEDLKYEPTVWVSTKKNKGQITISVKDNGNGIPEKVKDKIFQPFFTTKPTGEGTGLGLSMSYDIVKAHGGELLVETNEGEGTKFIIYLPA